jgi:Amt family ammonium transporter
MRLLVNRSLALCTLFFLLAHPGFAQAPPERTTPAPAAAAPVSITVDDVKNVAPPSAEERAQGDPGGTLTGTVSDVAVSDSTTGLTVGDVVNQVGQNKIAINFTWTLIAGFLVMFMQAGFAVVETGLCRAKNANHTMMMNFMVYGVGMLAYWLIGFAIQMGGVGAVGNLGGTPPLSSETTMTLFGKTVGIFGNNGLFLMHHGTYDVGVMVMFLFQMVFMDTGSHHRYRVGRRALEVRRFPYFLISAGSVHVSTVRELGLGWRLARHSRQQFRPGPRLL